MSNSPPKKPVDSTSRKPSKKPTGGKSGASGRSASKPWFLPVVVAVAVVVAVGAAVVTSALAPNKPANSTAKPSASSSPHVAICANQSPPLLPMKVTRSTPYPMTIDPTASYTAEMTTSCGTMLIKLATQEAPIAVNNFIHLAQDGFYTGLVFHRIDRSLGIIQSGDPGCPLSVHTCGTGGPGYTIRDEFHNGLKPDLGTVAMSSAGTPNSSGSQFEIIASKGGPRLPAERTIFGHLVGSHSYQVAKLILSIPTKIAPGAPPSAPKDFPDGEYVYITNIKITKS